jgi:hypothetical protein
MRDILFDNLSNFLEPVLSMEDILNVLGPFSPDG